MNTPLRPGFGRTRGALTVVAVALAPLWWWHSHSNPSAAEPAKTAHSIRVNSVKIARTDAPQYIEGLGAAQAFYTVTITPRVDGQLTRVAFTEGQPVKKGDLLAQIDPRPYQAALEQALATRDKDQALLDNAHRDLDRYEMLAPQDLASKQTLDTQKATVAQLGAQVKSDEAAIDNARTQLDYSTITSPIDGRTGIRLVDPGNNVHANDTTGIVVVTQLQPISVVFTLPEDDLAAVAAAMAHGPVAVTALSRDGHTELDRGTLALIDNQIDPSTGTVRLKATFPNAHNSLWPGEFVNARALLQMRHDVLTIPAKALQRGPDGLFTYVVRKDSTVEARPLTVADESTDPVVVSDGLKEGEQVVVSNQYRLQPNAQVETTTAELATAATAGSGQP